MKIAATGASVYSTSIFLMLTSDNPISSFTSRNKVFLLDVESPDSQSHFLIFVVAESAAAPGLETGDYHTNNLTTVHNLLSRIRNATDIPIREPILDSTLQHVPYICLLTQPLASRSSSLMSLASARSQGLLTAQDEALVELQLGKYLGQLHSGAQNDWFGIPLAQGDPADPSYSWQETFTLLLETLLSECQDTTGTKMGLPYENIRRYLSRAIGFFLFDDVEVPSLVWLTGSEHDIYLSSEKEVVAILPSVAHALWGDPLLESFFLPPAPSEAFLEAYTASGGERLLVFPRQKTKRLWYSVFLALVVLREHGWDHALGKAQEVVNLLQKSVAALEHAPCY